MSIGQVTNNSNLTQLLLQSLSSTQNSTPGVASLFGNGASGSNQSASSLTVSPMSTMMSQLQQLQTSNPAQFQQLASTIANQLTTAAQQQGNTQAGQFLSQLASSFQSVANGGSLSNLLPSQASASQTASGLQGAIQKAYGHHHHHHGQSGSTSSGQTDSSTSSTSTTGNSVQSVMQSIMQEVSQAVSGSTL